MKRSYFGPFWYYLCKNSNEDSNHLFLKCPITQDLWNNLLNSLHITYRWFGNNIADTWTHWWMEATGKERNVPLLICWAIWIVRNRIIFQPKEPYRPSILTRILADYHYIPNKCTQPSHRIINPENINTSLPWAYFDGSAQEIQCGGGAILHLSETHSSKFKWDSVEGPITMLSF